ncbi:MAG: RagB/SusD family nutrient uptake outer membrane protein [Rikenellaceae bacterium]|nr:RagB/SusD family nutrient uptake outer membrane protein [Rikenellaceae bacterium]
MYGILARVALTQQNYRAAGDYAAKAIALAEAEGHRIMTLEQADPELTPTVFPEISTQTKDALYAALTQDDQLSNTYSFYSYMSWNYNSTAARQGVKCISQTTYDLMSETDIRRAWWDPTGEAGAASSSHIQQPYQNRKFTAVSSSKSVGDFAFIRLTEMYLIAAEAYARAGDTSTAKKYFATFIAERDPAYTDLGNTGNDFAEEVMVHRRIELWGEGFRWFDLKRLNLPCYRTGNNFDEIFCGFLKKEITDQGWAYEIPIVESNYNEWYLEPGRLNYR